MLLRKIVRAAEVRPMDPSAVRKLGARPGLMYLEYEKTKPLSLSQLLPKKISGCLILILDHRKNSNVGHFIMLMRHPKSGITFFDPYGYGIHRLLKMTQNEMHLEGKLRGLRFFHDNKVAFQQRADDVETCGRHVITRWNAAGLNAKQYKQMMVLPGMSPDEIVTMLTLGADLAKASDRI